MLICGGTGAHVMIAKADANGDTIRLGDLDVTMSIPNIPPGTINFYNAVLVARGAVSAAMNMREIGPFATDTLGRVLGGNTSGDICDLGGSMSIDPQPSLPLAVGQIFAANYQDCSAGPPPGVQFQGGYTMELVSVIGDPTTMPYEITSVLAATITVTDDVGTTSLAGEVEFSRSATSASMNDERTDLATGSTLQIDSSGTTVFVTQGGLTNGLSGHLFYLGPADLVLSQTQVSGPLTLTIPAGQRFTGTVRDSPSTGWMSVEARDGSLLRITATGAGEVRLDVDTDGDGTVDYTRAMRWEDLD
jgi:hypothetical protein